MNSIPWELIRSFLAVADAGSLSAAARSLELSQPTLSRNIQTLESHTRLNLFKRTSQGLNLTEEGTALVEAAQQMNNSAETFARQVSGLSTELNGEIRISANEIVGIYLLPAVIAAFRKQHPAVHIEIVISNRASNLNKREADIALRMFHPKQPDLVARRLPDMPLGFYAHKSYLDQHGTPESFNELREHALIGFDQNRDFIDGARAMGFTFSNNDFELRTDSLMLQIQLALQGCGIVGTHVGVARQWPEMKRILEWAPIPPLEFWVVCHADTQYNARIRAFKRHLIAWFADDPYRGLNFS
ncbi:LysR family transcriptional regulator [Mariprofundus ferrooxydans]|uniref:Putative transcriptional regulator n=1 Tax=Mariprofundus ferrooxydans PV-1 TaxID=314345 RepID=Q0F1P8_9PROT|nr:LysR family transcriptional regulator [Mariprofundus ferrooxydans]EAU55143.1 putative transcriptional regulator [Mariprofundus ferrooxydans PV-1]KON47588.1 transcriptional regulator [Mariprofundus ferrooxydans]